MTDDINGGPQPSTRYETLAGAIQRVAGLPANASQHSTLADVYGVLTDCSLPRPTKGPDVVVNLRLIDPSTEDQAGLADGVEALVFCPKPERMPQSRNPGDIIRLHRVQVQSFNGKPQLLGRLSGGPQDPRRFTPLSFCMFDGSANGSNVPYASSTENPSFDASVDGQKLAQLRAFAQQQGITTADWQGSTTFLRKISDLCPPPEGHMSMVCIDIFCQILAVDERDAKETVLFVWDSTDARPLPSDLDIAAPLWHGKALTGSRIKRPLPLPAPAPASTAAQPSSAAPPTTGAPATHSTAAQPPSAAPPTTGAPASTAPSSSAPSTTGAAAAAPASTAPQPSSSALSSIKVAAELPDLGTALPVLLPAGALTCNRADVLSVGSWVKLKVVGPQVVKGQFQLVCGGSSRVAPASARQQTTDAYAARLASHDTATWAHGEHAVRVTRCLRQQLPLVSIRHVLKQRVSGRSATFRLLARVTSYLPLPVEDFCQPMPAQSSSSRQGQWTFACKLLLSDATGELDVLVLAEEAEQLFGVRATNLRQSPQQLLDLQRRLSILMDYDVNGGSWMDLAISSMYRAGAESPVLECKYILHDTVPADAEVD